VRRIAAIIAIAAGWLTSGATAAPGTGVVTLASSALALNAPVVGIAATPSGGGYWRVGADGAVLTAGNAHFYGSMGGQSLARPVAGMASTPTGAGYWLVASDGGIFAFGDARFYGSTGAMRLSQPIVGMASTPTGRGYWLVASDGGVFAFGDARFYGSTGAMRLSQPVVGIAATQHGGGYWMVARDGGIFAFGDARFYGSAGNLRLAQPITGMAAVPNGAGYLMVGADGGVFLYGTVAFYGSATGACPGRAVGVAMSGGATGYWIAFGDGRVYALSPSTKPPSCTPSGSTRAQRAAADLFQRINDERRGRGLPALAWNAQLGSYATAWSANMAANGFRHSDIGSLLGPFDFVGENIAMGSAGVSAGALHIAWMHSDGHRANLLAPGFDSVGVGVFCKADGSIWATEDFGRLTSSGPAPPPPPTPAVNPIVRTDPGTSTC
jgi:cysteine-rich secretory family protein